MSETMNAQYVEIPGHDGDSVQAYLVTTDEPRLRGGVVLIHHNPGFDRGTKEIARRFVTLGYDVLAPNLYCRQAPGASPQDAFAAVTAQGGVPDAQVIGDVNGAADYLRGLSSNNGKVAVAGCCSGGRHAVLTAIHGSFDAAIDLYGGGVTGPKREDNDPDPLYDQLPDLDTSLLGLFGNEDHHPTAAEVDELEEILKQQGKTYEFHRYDDTGHGFFNVDRGGYRPHAFNDAWARIEEYLGKHLGD